jgi:hypothetical protein
MSKLIATTFLTLDGVYQGPGGVEEDTTGGFDVGGWVTPFYEEGMAGLAEEWIAQAGAFLLGRRTHDIAHDLVDEYRLWQFPVVLGQGRRLFPDGVAPKAFEHVETRHTATGVNVLVLRPAGKPRFDTFRLVEE